MSPCMVQAQPSVALPERASGPSSASTALKLFHSCQSASRKGPFLLVPQVMSFPPSSSWKSTFEPDKHWLCLPLLQYRFILSLLISVLSTSSFLSICSVTSLNHLHGYWLDSIEYISWTGPSTPDVSYQCWVDEKTTFFNVVATTLLRQPKRLPVIADWCSTSCPAGAPAVPSYFSACGSPACHGAKHDFSLGSGLGIPLDWTSWMSSLLNSEACRVPSEWHLPGVSNAPSHFVFSANLLGKNSVSFSKSLQKRLNSQLLVFSASDSSSWTWWHSLQHWELGTSASFSSTSLYIYITCTSSVVHEAVGADRSSSKAFDAVNNNIKCSPLVHQANHLIAEGFQVCKTHFPLHKSLLAIPNHPLVLHMFGKGFHDYLLHHLPRKCEKYNQPAVP